MPEIDLSGIPKEIDLSGIPAENSIDLSGIPADTSGGVDLSGIPHRSLTAEDIPEIVQQIRQAVVAPPQMGEFTSEQISNTSNLSTPESYVSPETKAADEASLSRIKKIFYYPEDPFGVKGMKELGQAARLKGAGMTTTPEQDKALEDFTVENFKGIVAYPAAIAVAAQGVGWYLANKTLDGSIRAAREAIAKGLRAKGVPEAQAVRMADEGMTQAVAKAGVEPGVPEFVALRKSAQKGFGPKEGTPNAPAVAPVEPVRPVETPLGEPPASVAPAPEIAVARPAEAVIKPSTTLPASQQAQFMQAQAQVLQNVIGRGDISEAEVAPLIFDKAKDGITLREIVERKIKENPETAVQSAADEYHGFLQGVKKAAQAEATAPIETPLYETPLTRNGSREAMLEAQAEAAKKGLAERPTAPTEGWAKEVLPTGETNLVSPTGYQVLVPKGQDPAKMLAAIREVEKAEYGASQIGEAQAPDWKYVDAVKDPFKKNSWLEKIANSNKAEVTDTALSGVLDRIEKIEPEVGSNAWNVAWAVAKNPIASEATKARALALRDEWMKPGRFPEENPNAQKTGAQVESRGQEVTSPEGQGSGVYLRDNAKAGVEATGGEVRPPTEPPPPTPPVETPPAPMSDDDIVAKVRRSLANAKPEVALQKISYSKELAERFARFSQEYTAAGGGDAGLKAAMGQLKGELEKRAFEEIKGMFSQEEVDRLVRMIVESPGLKTWGDRISARDGLERMLQGRLPQKAQIAKLEKVFGKELVAELEKKRSSLAKMYDMGLQLVNVPRSLMASMDLSAPFRQGIFFVSRPEFWGEAWPNMIRSMKNEQVFNDLQLQIENDPDYPMLKDAGLDITGMSTVADREEDFAAPLIERAFKIAGVDVNVPGRLIRASGRAYVGFLNKLRMDVAKSMLKSAEAAGYTPTQDLVEKIVKYVNAGTGRGGLGPLQGAATALNAVFFSPRLMASRVNLMTKLLQPSFYEKNNAFIRQQYWRDVIPTVLLGNAILGLAYVAGAEVGTDPRSSDFGKIKIGNTRLDVWGGFQQYARMIGQLVAGEYVSSITGKVMTLGEGYKPLTRKDIAQRQLESKLSPTASFINAMMSQQDWEGKPVSVKKEIQERVLPLAMKDLYTVATTNPELLPISALGLVGFGVQTYGDAKVVDYAKMSKSMSFQDIVKTLEITSDPKARTQLFQAGIKKFPGAIQKAQDKEAVKALRVKMVEEYRKRVTP